MTAVGDKNSCKPLQNYLNENDYNAILKEETLFWKFFVKTTLDMYECGKYPLFSEKDRKVYLNVKFDHLQRIATIFRSYFLGVFENKCTIEVSFGNDKANDRYVFNFSKKIKVKKAYFDYLIFPVLQEIALILAQDCKMKDNTITLAARKVTKIKNKKLSPNMTI